MSNSKISPYEFATLCQHGQVELIDVRTPKEFQELHVANARNVPLDRLDPATLMRQRSGASDDRLYVICRSGGRGKQACEKLHQAGLANVVNIDGGTLACEQAGLPMVRGQKTISLERQVRIAAGSLVLLGAVLGATVHLGFVALSGFVGAGLVFSGVTDTCGMGLLLARMPWNQDHGSNQRCDRSIHPSLQDTKEPLS